MGKTTKISKKSLYVIVLLFIFAFQRQMNNLIPYFEYFDELFFIFMLSHIILLLISKSKRIDLNDKKTYLIMILLLSIGLIGNIISKVLNDFFYISVDIISVFKVLISYYYIKTLRLNSKECKEVYFSL